MLLPRRLNRHRKRDFKVSPLSYARQVKAQYLGCSEGSGGLFVLWGVGGIFTAVSISPSTSWRQWPSDYAIHARRNLPDKELRYLRLRPRRLRVAAPTSLWGSDWLMTFVH